MHRDEKKNRLLLSSMIPGSPIEKAGGQIGDVVVGIAGVAISSFDDFVEYAKDSPTTGVSIDLIRNNQFITLFIPKKEDE